MLRHNDDLKKASDTKELPKITNDDKLRFNEAISDLYNIVYMPAQSLNTLYVDLDYLQGTLSEAMCETLKIAKEIGVYKGETKQSLDNLLSDLKDFMQNLPNKYAEDKILHQSEILKSTANVIRCQNIIFRPSLSIKIFYLI